MTFDLAATRRESDQDSGGYMFLSLSGNSYLFLGIAQPPSSMALVIRQS